MSSKESLSHMRPLSRAWPAYASPSTTGVRTLVPPIITCQHRTMQTTRETTANVAARDRAGSVPRFTALDGSSDESSWFGRLAAA
jgi:hypothetical protein